MTLKIADRVFETTTTTGTGTVILGGAVQGFQGFAVIGNGIKSPYYIDDADSTGIAQNWEAGIGTVSISGSVTSVSRDTILASSNSNIVVNFGAGSKNVRGGIPAAMFPVVDENLNSVRNRPLNTSGSTANIHAIQLGYTPLAYSDGMIINYKIPFTNTNAGVTVNLNGKGAVPLKYFGADPGIGALNVGMNIYAAYNSTLGQFDILNQITFIAGRRNYIINGGCQVSLQGNIAAVNNVVTYGGAEMISIQPQGFSSFSGTIAQMASNYTKTGSAQALSNFTTAGTGLVDFIYRMEAKDAVALNGKQIQLSCLAFQDSGAAVSVNWLVSKANAADNFSSTTFLYGGANISVPTGLNLGAVVSNPFTLAAADATNGLEFRIRFNSLGALSSKNLQVSLLQCEEGPIPTLFEHSANYATEFALCQRYFQIVPRTSGNATNATQIYTTYTPPVPMRIPPTLSLISGATLNNAESPPTITSRSQSAAAAALNGGDNFALGLLFSNYSGMTAPQPAVVTGGIVSLSARL